MVPHAPGLAAVQVIKVPTSAVRKDGQGSAVWVLDRQTMTLRSQAVQVATADGNVQAVANGAINVLQHEVQLTFEGPRQMRRRRNQITSRIHLQLLCSNAAVLPGRTPLL